MDKRYQVFISSTYADLQEERQEVIQALLELDCIPAGMELFPAANEDQWTLIKKVIDDCDYYMVIVAGRYGSLGKEGLSYTEMEYRYALEQGKPIIGFVHKQPDELAANRCESTDDGKAKLKTFSELVKQKMCRFWSSPADLGSQVSRSLIKLIKSNPGIGWVRGNLVPDESSVEEMLALRRKIDELQLEISKNSLATPKGTENLSQGEDLFSFLFSFGASRNDFMLSESTHESCTAVSWNEIFYALSPLMMNEASEGQLLAGMNSIAEEFAAEELQKIVGFKKSKLVDFKVDLNDFHTVKIQLRALGLITKNNKSRSVKDTGTYWTLTPYGDNVMTRLRAIQKPLN
ncbi:MAG: DUF4062 domain-containing protein [Burkholderiaceae bacterium]